MISHRDSGIANVNVVAATGLDSAQGRLRGRHHQKQRTEPPQPAGESFVESGNCDHGNCGRKRPTESWQSLESGIHPTFFSKSTPMVASLQTRIFRILEKLCRPPGSSLSQTNRPDRTEDSGNVTRAAASGLIPIGEMTGGLWLPELSVSKEFFERTDEFGVLSRKILGLRSTLRFRDTSSA